MIGQDILEMEDLITNTGESIAELSEDNAVMLVFLRHFGCTFCREALADISERQGKLEEMGVQVVFVHMASNEEADEYFPKFGLENIRHISNEDCDLYEQFSLVKGNFKQLFGLNTWIRGFEAGVMKKLGVGKIIGDGFQMPGVFIIRNGIVREQFIHESVSDRPDYEQISQCCIA